MMNTDETSVDPNAASGMVDNGFAGDGINETIDAAETMRDPLEDLAERTKTDPGTPFTPDVLEALAALKLNDRAAFQRLRAELKTAKCMVTALDEALAGERDSGGRGPTQADTLIELAQAAELFHTTDETAFADLDIDGHRETWRVRSRGFRRWLARRYFEDTGGAPNSEALQSALGVIEAKAHYDGPLRAVHVRVGSLDGVLYLDLGDDTWRAVEIDTRGWRVIATPPVRFIRAPGMKPLPMPVSGGGIEALRPFVNVKSEGDFALAVCWVLAALRNRGPYPVLAVTGEQGSAKSTFSSILRALVDPNSSPLRAIPREERDLFIAASNGHVLAFDNISGLPHWTSDTLCRLATGGGFAVRQLYSDGEEVLFDATRPIILNGIEDIVTRPDLAERALLINLGPIPEDKRRPEAELWAAFEARKPVILGALLDAMVYGLEHLPSVHLAKLPRMADFALWAVACEGAFWPAGTFEAAYDGNRDSAIDDVIEADPVASAVRNFMAARTDWTGTAAQLLKALGETAGDGVVRSRGWPKTPNHLSGQLTRAATFLRKAGVMVEQNRTYQTRSIRITRTPSPDSDKRGNSSSSSSSPSLLNVSNIIPMTMNDDGRGGHDDGPNFIVMDNSLINNTYDDHDDDDGDFPDLSELEKKRCALAWSGQL